MALKPMQIGSVQVGRPQEGRFNTQIYTPDAFGAAQGRGLADMGKAVGQGADLAFKIGMEEKAKENKAELNKAQTEYLKTKFELEWGENGWRHQKGEAAKQAAMDAQVQLEMFRQNQLKMYEGNEAIISQLDPFTVEHGLRHDEEAYTYAHREIEQSRYAAAEAKTQTLQQEYMKAPTPDNMYALRESIRESVLLKGLPESVADAMIADNVSKAHNEVLENLLADNKTEEAKSYFNTYKKEFNGQTLSEAKDKLENQDRAGKAAHIANTLASANLSQEQLSDAMLTMAGDDPKLYKAVQQELQFKYAQNERAKKELEEQARMEAIKVADDGQLPSVVMPTGTKEQQKYWASLNEKQRNSLDEYARKSREGGLIESPVGAMIKYTQMSTGELIGIDESELRMSLSKRDADTIISMRDSVIKSMRDSKESSRPSEIKDEIRVNADRYFPDDKAMNAIYTIQAMQWVENYKQGNNGAYPSRMEMLEEMRLIGTREYNYSMFSDRTSVIYEVFTDENDPEIINNTMKLLRSKGGIRNPSAQHVIAYLGAERTQAGSGIAAAQRQQVMPTSLENAPPELVAHIRAQLKKQGSKDAADDHAVLKYVWRELRKVPNRR